MGLFPCENTGTNMDGGFICGNMWGTHHGVPAQGIGGKVEY